MLWKSAALSIAYVRIFSKHIEHIQQEIGQRSARAMAALSRSALRLADRGLAVCVWAETSRWAGLNVTAAGVEVARRCDDTGTAMPPAD